MKALYAFALLTLACVLVRRWREYQDARTELTARWWANYVERAWQWNQEQRAIRMARLRREIARRAR